MDERGRNDLEARVDELENEVSGVASKLDATEEKSEKAFKSIDPLQLRCQAIERRLDVIEQRLGIVRD